jgi:hypothetical protein
MDVIFVMPRGDGRDYDTRIAVEVTSGDVEAAQNDNLAPGQSFKDPGTYGPFAIHVITPFREGNYLQSITKVTFVSVRGERWITDIAIFAKFSHGLTYVSHSGVVVFDQNTSILELRNDSGVRMLSNQFGALSPSLLKQPSIAKNSG